MYRSQQTHPQHAAGVLAFTAIPPGRDLLSAENRYRKVMVPSFLASPRKFGKYVMRRLLVAAMLALWLEPAKTSRPNALYATLKGLLRIVDVDIIIRVDKGYWGGLDLSPIHNVTGYFNRVSATTFVSARPQAKNGGYSDGY
jgi:hypothetical protein